MSAHPQHLDLPRAPTDARDDCRCAFVEYALHLMVFRTFNKGQALVDEARKKLMRVSGMHKGLMLEELLTNEDKLDPLVVEKVCRPVHHRCGTAGLDTHVEKVCRPVHHHCGTAGLDTHVHTDLHAGWQHHHDALGPVVWSLHHAVHMDTALQRASVGHKKV